MVGFSEFIRHLRRRSPSKTHRVLQAVFKQSLWSLIALAARSTLLLVDSVP